MASGPWFFFQNVTILGAGDPFDNDYRLVPPFPTDPRIDRNTWVWASITELDSNGLPHLGDAPMWIENTVPQDDGSIWVRVRMDFPKDLPGMIRLLYWTGMV